MRYISCDIETLGLDSKNDSLLQIAMIIDTIEEGVDPKPLSELPKLLLWVDSPIRGNIQALDMHLKSGLLARWIQEHKNDYQECVGIIQDFLYKNYKIKSGEKRNFAGKNFSGFDRPFLRDVLPYKKVDIESHNRIIDPAMHYVDYEKDDVLPSLEMCKKRANFESTIVTHDALDDAFDIIKLIRYHVYGKEFHRDSNDSNFFSTIYCPF